MQAQINCLLLKMKNNTYTNECFLLKIYIYLHFKINKRMHKLFVCCLNKYK